MLQKDIIIYFIVSFFIVCYSHAADIKVSYGVFGFSQKIVNGMVGDQVIFELGTGAPVRLTQTDTPGVCKRSTKPDAFFGELIPGTTPSVTFQLKTVGKVVMYNAILDTCLDNQFCTINIDERPATAPASDTPPANAPPANAPPANAPPANAPAPKQAPAQPKNPPTNPPAANPPKSDPKNANSNANGNNITINTSGSNDPLQKDLPNNTIINSSSSLVLAIIGLVTVYLII